MSPDDTERFGERIKLAREARGWTQYQLGVAIGQPPAYLSRWENGHATPKVTIIRDSAVALGVSWEYLTCLTDDLDASLDPTWRDPSMPADTRQTRDAPKGRVVPPRKRAPKRS